MSSTISPHKYVYEYERVRLVDDMVDVIVVLSGGPDVSSSSPDSGAARAHPLGGLGRREKAVQQVVS